MICGVSVSTPFSYGEVADIKALKYHKFNSITYSPIKQDDLLTPKKHFMWLSFMQECCFDFTIILTMGVMFPIWYTNNGIFIMYFYVDAHENYIS